MGAESAEGLFTPAPMDGLKPVSCATSVITHHRVYMYKYNYDGNNALED